MIVVPEAPDAQAAEMKVRSGSATGMLRARALYRKHAMPIEMTYAVLGVVGLSGAGLFWRAMSRGLAFADRADQRRAEREQQGNGATGD